jgi:hypothetical protein
MSIIPAALATAVAQGTVQPFYAVEFGFDVRSGFDVNGDPIEYGPVRFWTGYGDRVIEGDTYLGSGTLMSVGDVETVADMSAPAITITLSGIPGNLISLALQEPYQRRECRIYFGAIINDAGDHSVFTAYVGKLNKMTIEDSAETGTIAVLVDSLLIEADKAAGWRYTSESHKSRLGNSTDTFFDYVAAIQDAEIVWGRKSA